MEMSVNEQLQDLASLLRNRIEVIGDKALRESDPDAQLEKLKNVSEAIFSKHETLKGQIHPRLEHFLSGCSYEKALVFIENELNS
jgi:hypothetical protein